MRSKRITRTRYYCGFCEAEGRLKGFWGRKAIEKHERGCTANPERICGICESAWPALKQKPIAELKACLSLDKEDFGMAELRALAEDCPACILAGIRQSNIQKSTNLNEDGRVIDFDFKSELQEFWNQVNEAAAENCSI